MRSGVVLTNLILTVTVFVLVDLFWRRRGMPVSLMVSAGVTLVAARVCWLLDAAGKFSGPDTWLQGHAVWHLLTALSLARIYLYYRGERVPTGGDLVGISP